MPTPTDPPSPEPDVEIDLGESEPAAEASEDRARLGRFLSNTVLTLGAVVLLLASGVVATAKLVTEQRTEAEQLVWAFLEAVLDGDAERALSMTDHSNPSMLLPAEALDDRWAVLDVAQVAVGSGGLVEVYVAIETHDGVKVGDRLTVEDANGAFRLSNVLKRVQWHAPFGQPVVNGVPIDVDDEYADRRYDLLPGPYAFEERLPPSMEREALAMVVLGSTMIRPGSTVSTAYVPSPGASLSEAGRERFDEAMREFLDACVDGLNAGEQLMSCPVGPMVETRTEGRGSATLTWRREGFEGARWEVIEYPTAEVEAWWGPPPSPVYTVDPGLATVVLSGGVVLECLIWMDGATASFLPDGDIEVAWRTHATEGGDRAPSPGCQAFTEAG